MDDVAREAEISRQALYAHFADKDPLFRECMKRGVRLAIARRRVRVATAHELVLRDVLRFCKRASCLVFSDAIGSHASSP